jgi:hypothetical protein
MRRRKKGKIIPKIYEKQSLLCYNGMGKNGKCISAKCGYWITDINGKKRCLIKATDYHDFEKAKAGEVYVCLHRNDQIFGIGPMSANNLTNDFRKFRKWNLEPKKITEYKARELWLEFIRQTGYGEVENYVD